MTFGEGIREGRARFEVNALKGPGLLSAVVWEPTLPSWLDVCCFPSCLSLKHRLTCGRYPALYKIGLEHIR